MLATLEEVGRSSLEVEIDYKAYPAEPMVRYYPDGSGYPGCPAHAELQAVRVLRWDVEDNERPRDSHWLWNDLDRIAFAVVEDEWQTFEALCLEDHAALEEEMRGER